MTNEKAESIMNEMKIAFSRGEEGLLKLYYKKEEILEAIRRAHIALLQQNEKGEYKIEENKNNNIQTGRKPVQ